MNVYGIIVGEHAAYLTKEGICRSAHEVVQIHRERLSERVCAGDVWVFGCLTVYFATGMKPFTSADDHRSIVAYLGLILLTGEVDISAFAPRDMLARPRAGGHSVCSPMESFCVLPLIEKYLLQKTVRQV